MAAENGGRQRHQQQLQRNEESSKMARKHGVASRFEKSGISAACHGGALAQAWRRKKARMAKMAAKAIMAAIEKLAAAKKAGINGISA